MLNSVVRKTDLYKFRISLLNTILISAFIFSFFIATLSVFNIFPLNAIYMKILYGYSFINLVAYYLFKHQHISYIFTISIILLTSLFTFTIMTISVLHDEFRLVWFFLTSFASFILGGKYLGFMTSSAIIFIILFLYLTNDINLSVYAIFTFTCALIVFNTFAYFFLVKIENDENRLQEKVTKELQKQKIQEQMLLQQYRMASMGEMIDAIAHQWKHPLMESNMILLNMNEILDNKHCDKGEMKKKIEELTLVTEHMSKTVDNFRSLLENRRDKSTFFIDKSIEEVLTLMKNNLKEVNIIYAKSDTLPIVSYKNELMQVFIILFANAIEALTQRKIQNKTLHIIVEENTDGINIHIEDNAGGVEHDLVNKIFDPYFSTKKKLKGTGLGLYIAKIIIEQNMKGQLLLTNLKNGARFTIKIRNKL